jgi:hypothetical protein
VATRGRERHETGAEGRGAKKLRVHNAEIPVLAFVQNFPHRLQQRL